MVEYSLNFFGPSLAKYCHDNIHLEKLLTFLMRIKKQNLMSLKVLRIMLIMSKIQKIMLPALLN